MEFARFRLPFAALAALAIFICTEVVSRAVGDGSPGVKRLLVSIGKMGPKPKPPEVSPTTAPGERNPFDVTDRKAQQMMPFVGYGFVTTDLSTPITRDYFGFRNHLGDDVYIHHDRPLIIMTGNSELAGLTHPDDISVLLERALEKRGLQFSVLNLAVNGYSLAAEIASYVQFGDRACPSLVISHSGAVDAAYGMLAPAKFKRLGLNYHPPMVEWAYRTAFLKEYTGSVWQERDPDARMDKVYDGVEMLIAQYRSLVERNGHTKFLFGVQKLGPPLTIFPFMSETVQEQMYKQLRGSLDKLRINYIWFSDDEDIQMADNIHTTPASAAIIADHYADFIVAHQSELHLFSGDASHCWWRSAVE